MLSDLLIYFANTWRFVTELAPYLLFGFGLAGTLHVLIKPELVQRYLGIPGLGSVVKASLMGVPIPLCSCSVIPVAAALRRSGASRGATASFLSSTPQTGVDSIMATCALLGSTFAAVRVFVAFLCGVLTGYLIELFCKEATTPQTNDPKLTPLIDTRDETNNCYLPEPGLKKRSLLEALHYGFITLPADLANSLTAGLLLSGLIVTVMPENILTGPLSNGTSSFVLATIISIPLYVCATASIPMAYALIVTGLSPGAVLVFLIIGPATNTATIATAWKMLGRKATSIYLISLIGVAWCAGWLFNTAIKSEPTLAIVHTHEIFQPKLWQHSCGLLLAALILLPIFKSWRTKN